MQEPSTVFVGLDTRAESAGIAVARPGRAAGRFIGIMGCRFAELNKALTKLALTAPRAATASSPHSSDYSFIFSVETRH